MRTIARGCVVGLMILALGSIAPAVAQVAVSSADIQRLQDSVYDVGADIARLRSRDADQAGRLQGELDDLREEVVYLKVKLRKERTVARSEYVDLRDKLEDLRTRARGDSGGRYSSPGATTTEHARTDRDRVYESTRATGTTGRANEIPVGTEIDVRLQTPLTSKTAQVEDRFEATTLVDLTVGDRVLVPAGSLMRGVITSVDRASRTDRKGELTVSFDQMTVKGRSYPIRGTVTQAIESEGIKGEAARIGTGAGVGAIIGGILGGFKGALAGILIGAGGTVAATEGKDVELPAGTILRVRIDSPVTIR